jgi:hypothetical protein
MRNAETVRFSITWISLFFLSLFCLAGISAAADDVPPSPVMPAYWKVIADHVVPPEQVKIVSAKLGAELKAIRNTIYTIDGRRVQINVIVPVDAANAEKLMAGLAAMKSEEALLRKGSVVYEFVGRNNVLPLIAEGREHLASQ